MLWQLTRAGVSLLGIYFIGLGLVEWGRAIAELVPTTAQALNEPLSLEDVHLDISVRVTWLSFAFPAAFGLLLVLASGPIALLLVPVNADRATVGLPELLYLGVSLIGLFLLLTAASAAARTLIGGMALAVLSGKVHPSHVVPHFLGNLVQAFVGFLIIKNSQRVSRWV